MPRDGVPIVVRFTGAEFNMLEQIAARKGTTIRDLIAGHVRAGLTPERVIRPTGRMLRSRRALTDTEIDGWVAAAEAGLTNNEIAARAGVSKSLVSRYLIERGVRRKSRRPV